MDRGSRKLVCEKRAEEVKNTRLQQRVRPFKQVQVVYYLSRNGHLEHPHFMEVTHLANQPLRLKEVKDRLLALRGKGMPTLYSWSYKRSYKNGYVWCDLAEHDVIHPTDGSEYVLKGSELVEGCSERFPQLRSQPIPQESNLNLKKSKGFGSNPEPETEEYEQEYEEVEEEYEDGEKTSYTSSTTTPHSRCSKGVSTEELEEAHQTHKNISPPTPPTALPSDRMVIITKENDITNEERAMISKSKRFEECKEPGSSRNSVLLQLIACGSSAVFKAKSVGNQSNGNGNGNGVKRRESHVMGDDDMIKYMSENPRFGNLQSEEKEYFSGGIVESMSEAHRVIAAQPVLKKSNSFNEEEFRSNNKVGFGEEMKEEDRKEKAVGKGKCIPLIKSCTSSYQCKK